MDIMSAINSAGGIGAIAQHLGIDEATAQSGVGALLPQVVNGIENNGLPADAETAAAPDASSPQAGGGLGGMLGGLLGGGGSGGLGAMFGGGGGGMGGVLGSLVGGGVGNQVLGHIFGSKDASREVAADASQKTGIDSSVLKKMLPIVAGMVAMHYMTNRGQGGADSGQGGAGGGMLGSILGGLGR